MLAPIADVIVTVSSNLSTTLACLRSVLQYSGSSLGRLLVIDDFGAESVEALSLQRLAEVDVRVHRVKGTSYSLGFADLCNRGLLARVKDVVLLSSECVVTRDWLLELAGVAHSEERMACASPMINEAGTCCVTGPDRRPMLQSPDEAAVRLATDGLPRWTIAPVLSEHCLYLRSDAIDAVGLLDPTIVSAREALDDWVMRAQSLGLMAKRANRAYVQFGQPHSRNEATTGPIESTSANHARQPHLEHQLKQFNKSLDGHLAAHAVQMETNGKLRVAIDFRRLPREQVGTRTHGVGLARALAGIPELDLTLLVADPSQAHGLKGRVVTEDQWEDDVSVIHKPSQFLSPAEMPLLFGSSAHIVLSYLDLIGYRIPLVFPTDADFDEYRAITNLSMQAVQRVLALSENSAEEIHAEFGVSHDDITVTLLAVESEWFAHRGERDVPIAWRMGLSDRYFLSLATDFPHKNLPKLLDAYALLRSRWRDGEPPDLVLAGHASGARTGFYRKLKANTVAKGLRVLGAVSQDELRVLYQNAKCLVYPSLYEGFGLPPLEAMAAGTPVIAMPISAVPEVCGDCALYPDGLSTNDLARAMEAFASNEQLRDEFRARGLKWVETFRWEKTARCLFDAYRSTVSKPSERSLRMRRHLREVIMRWGPPAPAIAPPPAPEPMGIVNSLSALQSAIHTRLGREARRFRLRAHTTHVPASPVSTSTSGTPITQETHPRAPRTQNGYHVSSRLRRILRSEVRGQTQSHEESLTPPRLGAPSSRPAPKH